MTQDIEKILDDIDTFLKANLNTQIAALNTEKGDSISLTTVDSDSYFYQSLNNKVANADPFVFYGVVDSVSEPAGPVTGVTYTIQVVIAKVDSGNDPDIGKRILRYGRVLKDLFENKWSSVSGSAKFEVSSLQPAGFDGLLNNSAKYRVVGVNLQTSIA